MVASPQELIWLLDGLPISEEVMKKISSVTCTHDIPVATYVACYENQKEIDITMLGKFKDLPELPEAIVSSTDSNFAMFYALDWGRKNLKLLQGKCLVLYEVRHPVVHCPTGLLGYTLANANIDPRFNALHRIWDSGTLIISGVKLNGRVVCISQHPVTDIKLDMVDHFWQKDHFLLPYKEPTYE